MRSIHEFNFCFRQYLPFSIRGVKKALKFYYLIFTELNSCVGIFFLFGKCVGPVLLKFELKTALRVLEYLLYHKRRNNDN